MGNDKETERGKGKGEESGGDTKPRVTTSAAKGRSQKLITGQKKR
jgi:hypothetical protein